MILIAVALAVDLDVKLTTPDGHTASMTFHDVETTQPAAFVVPFDGKPDVRVVLLVHPEPRINWEIETTVEEVRSKGHHGQHLTVLASSRLTAQQGEPGTEEQGRRVPVPGTDP